jgi:hypothetical protein
MGFEDCGGLRLALIGENQKIGMEFKASIRMNTKRMKRKG